MKGPRRMNDMARINDVDVKSQGHLCFIGAHEYFQTEGGRSADVCLVLRTNVMGSHKQRCGARWECSLSFWEDGYGKRLVKSWEELTKDLLES